MTESYGCIVMGLGGFGSGVLDSLAMRGVHVLGLEQFGIAHNRGSSHGETRIIRKAYFEHPDYVPLLKRAYDLWENLELDSGRTLKVECGLMIAGLPDSGAVSGARLSSEQHRIPLENLSAREARSRFRGFHVPDEFEVAYESQAGFLFVEDCIRAQSARAEKNGATIHLNETVQRWRSHGQTVEVETDRGRYSAQSVVITTGPWAGNVLRELNIPLEVARKPLFWHETVNLNHSLDRDCPAFFYELGEGEFYGFPSLEGSEIKVAQHTGGQTVSNPAMVNRDILPEDLPPIQKFLANCLPGVNTNPLRHSVCMYTRTPDCHFIVDCHPEHKNVVIGAGFSGHGFKFTTVLGEAMADLAMNGKTDLPIDFLSLSRESIQR
ncbi:MAG: N-methyl-L-tryptophan oxidase [Planctomycetaceae bacterium]